MWNPNFEILLFEQSSIIMILYEVKNAFNL